MSALAFYISGHGFGHASRDVEVINALGRRAPSARVTIRTAAARWLFDLTVTFPYDLHPLETDTGVVQQDSLRHDVPGTLRRAVEFYRTFDERVEREAAFLERLGATLVVGDIPPLAFAAAARAGLPSFALGNFTWDWIYDGYLGSDPAAAAEVVSRIEDAYAQASGAWRLPMHGGFGSFGNVVDVPFVARHSRRDREETRRHFGLPLDRRVVLSSFGGYGLRGLPLERVDCLGDFTVVVSETSARDRERRTPHPSVVTLQENAIYDAGFRYEDLVRAADVVLTKPGYGIIAECVANDTALVYTSRGEFREYPVLVRDMPRFLRCAFMEQADLFAGRWRAPLEAALSRPEPPEQPRTDGAERVAELISASLPG